MPNKVIYQNKLKSLHTDAPLTLEVRAYDGRVSIGLGPADGSGHSFKCALDGDEVRKVRRALTEALGNLESEVGSDVPDEPSFITRRP